MADESKQELIKLLQGNGQEPIEVTPLQLLGLILKSVLKDRITDEEVDTICSVYYKTVKDIWG